jgi:hypothetical protein
MLPSPRVPALITAARTWSNDEVAAQAAVWRDEMRALSILARPLFVVVPPSSLAVPLILAATALPSWIAVLPSDPSMWPGPDHVPRDAVVVLLADMPGQGAAGAMGRAVHQLSAPGGPGLG